MNNLSFLNKIINNVCFYNNQLNDNAKSFNSLTRFKLF